MKSKNATIAFLAIIILISSNSCLGISHFVIITDQSPDAIQLDPFDLESIEIEGDNITLHITYSGGCGEHSFSLCMSPAAFLESYPVQANLYLQHNSNGDTCEALINDDLTFNLHPIAELHKIYYGKYDEIILNVFEYKSNSQMSGSYVPE